MKHTQIFVTIAFAVAAIAAVLLFPPSETIVTQLPPTPPQCDFACLVEQRTLAIFERDRLDYLEQSRLKALSEINQESQQMVYESPYITL